MPEKPEEFLDNLVSNLGSSYGAEKSIKILHSAILSKRLLLSIHKNALGSQPEENLLGILQQLQFPARFNDLVTSRLALADIVHFGCEDYGKGHIYKCYLECAETTLQVRDSKSLAQHLVHYALKWDPQNTDNLKISHYFLQPSADLKAVRRFLTGVYQDKGKSVAYKMMLEILKLDQVNANEADLMLLSVTEENNPRYSFDLNLYNADLRLFDIASQLSKTIEYFDADMSKWNRLYQCNKTLQLGHLSGGVDGNGREFFTVYFGVEGRGLDSVA